MRCYRPLIRAVAFDYPVAGPALHWYGDALSSRTRFFTALSDMCEDVAVHDEADELAATGQITKRRLILEPCQAFR
jgi:hypothetical protein